jgi:hypothetical protein
MPPRLTALLLALVLGAPAPAPAWESAGTEVDVELVLAVDVSLSVSARELDIQRRGYAEAITSPQVMAAVAGGLLGRIAVPYVEWAGRTSQRTVIDWTLIETQADARAFAARLLERPGATRRRTSISAALLHAARSFDDNRFAGLRRVIDVSGDGPNNAGRPVLRARDAVLARGIVINGLPLMTREGFGGRWDIDDLDLYYTDCVVGGPGAFVIPVRDWDAFAGAVRRKLVLEIAGRAPRAEPAPVPASTAPPRRTDCLIGEKIWERNRMRFDGTP